MEKLIFALDKFEGEEFVLFYTLDIPQNVDKYEFALQEVREFCEKYLLKSYNRDMKDNDKGEELGTVEDILKIRIEDSVKSFKNIFKGLDSFILTDNITEDIYNINVKNIIHNYDIDVSQLQNRDFAMYLVNFNQYIITDQEDIPNVNKEEAMEWLLVSIEEEEEEEEEE